MLARILAPFRHPILPLFLTVFLDLLGFGIALPVLAVVFLDPTVSIVPHDVSIEYRRLGYGLLVASYPFMQFFGAPIIGALSDRYGRKSLLILSLCGTAIGYVLFGVGIHLRSVSLLFVSRMLDGFTGGNISIALSALADTSTDAAQRARRFGILGMAFGLGFILGPYIGGKLADPRIFHLFDAATPFWFAAILTVVNIIVCLLLFQETLRTHIQTPVSLLTGMRNIALAFTLPHVRAMFIVIFFLTLGFNFFTQFFQVILIEWFQFTSSDIADFFAYVGFWIAITQGILMRPLSRWFSPQVILRVSSLLLGCTLFILLIPGSWQALYVVVPFIAIFQGLTQPNATTIVSSLSDEASQGEIMGIFQSVQALGMMIPPLISGIVANVHLSIPIIAAGAFTIVGWLIFVVTIGGAVTAEFHEQ
jgi:DHA1 family tetracycline resistance protein-like MFS transporter